MHLPRSRFRRLPNPCAATWNPNLNVIEFLLAFSRNIKNSHYLGDHQLVKELQGLFTNARFDSVGLDNRMDEYIRAHTDSVNIQRREWDYAPGREREAYQQQVSERYNTAHRELLDSLDDHIQSINSKLKDMLDDVREVLTCHFISTSRSETRQELETQLAGESLVNTKEKILIDCYFNNVLPEVAQGLPDSSAGTPQRSSSLRPPSITVTESDASTLANTGSDTRSAVWLVLMFKMCSWLFLHDFHPEDRMIERSEFRDNRLPVYIG
jgi:hypothetical protein